MQLDYAARHVLGPALALLPRQMDTSPARAMLLAIALQESGLRHRRQIRGPARGYWQFELIGLQEVVQHPASAGHMAAVVDALDYGNAPPVELHHALEHNDILAACVARLALWRSPEIMPARPHAETGWTIYQSIWRPGKPHPERWAECWDRAWRTVAP